MNTKHLLAGASFAALWQVAGHYIPPARPWERPGVATRIGAYTYGTTGILLGLALATDGGTAGRAFVIAAASGAATVAVYVADHIARLPAEKVFHAIEAGRSRRD